MRAPFQVWLVIVVIATIIFVLQTFFAAHIGGLLLQYGLDEYVERGARGVALAVEQTTTLVTANWPGALEAIGAVLPFWWGVFTVLVVWGLLELIYAARRKPAYAAGAPAPISQAAIEETLVLLNQGKEFRTADARRTIASALDDLYAEGTKHRDALIPPLEHFRNIIDFDNEDARLEAWNEQALKVLDHPLIAVAERSRFRTLDSFEPEIHPMDGKSPRQDKLEAVWSEKLNRLRAIIDNVGAEPGVTRLEPVEPTARGRQLPSPGSGGG
ncbi:MAG: hypothetical protein WD036_06730 [Bauldia sp.]